MLGYGLFVSLVCSMKVLTPYLLFAGNCQDALNFYEQAFNGKTVMRQTFGQAPQPVKGVNPSHIMHAEFKAEAIAFMASDGLAEATTANNICLSINFTDEQEQQTCFKKLSENGTVLMPLSPTFWGAKFGKLEDQFGIQWMLNCQLPKDA